MLRAVLLSVALLSARANPQNAKCKKDYIAVAPMAGKLAIPAPEGGYKLKVVGGEVQVTKGTDPGDVYGAVLFTEKGMLTPHGDGTKWKSTCETTLYAGFGTKITDISKGAKWEDVTAGDQLHMIYGLTNTKEQQLYSISYTAVDAVEEAPEVGVGGEVITTVAPQVAAVGDKLCNKFGTWCMDSKIKENDENTLIIDLEGEGVAYVSIGIHLDDKTAMDGAMTHTCVAFNDKVVLVEGVNVGKTNNRVEVAVKEDEVNSTNSTNSTTPTKTPTKTPLLKGNVTEKGITCQFERALIEKANIIWALSDTPVTDLADLGMHTGNTNGKKVRGPEIGQSIKKNFVTGEVETDLAPESFGSKYAAAITMYTFVFLLSVTVLILRFGFPKNYTLLHARKFGTLIGSWAAVLMFFIFNLTMFIYYMVLYSMAVAFGVLAGMNMGCTLLPSARNSMWTFVLGISFERAIKFHRWASCATLVFGLAHMICLILNFGSEILGTTDAFGPRETVPIFGSISFFTILTMGIAAFELVRRKAFEVFWYVHQLMYLAVLFGILHTPQNFMMLLPGVILHTIDLTIRLFQMMRKFEVKAEVLGGVTKLSLTSVSKNFKFEAGQYCFLRVPCVSALQIHPFSISSAPGESPVTFHIKNMGEGTFTNDLMLAAKGNAINEVHVMGPHGTVSVPMKKYKTVVLCAGGVGITPMASIYQSFKDSSNRGSITKAVLVWSARGETPLRTWFPKLENKGAKELQLMCYNTSNGQAEENPIAGGEKWNGPVNKGRPDYDAIISTAMQENGSSAEDTCVLACGPAKMVAAIEALCNAKQIHFHKETFLL